MGRIDKLKGGNITTISNKFNGRHREGGKLCNKCKKVRKLDQYYTTSTLCKFCMNKLSRERYKKQNKPLW